MTKELAKLFQDLKDELKSEFKAFKEAVDRSMRTEERNIRAELAEMKTSMEFINKSFEDANRQAVATAAENSALKKENETLRQRVNMLEQGLLECQTNLVKAEQYSRNKNLEIKGVLQEPNESLPDILKKIGDAVGEPISCTDIDVCHRVPTKDKKHTNLIVQFQRRDKRDQVLEKARKKRITNATLGLASLSQEAQDGQEDSPIYINEHLCPFMKKLLGASIARKRACAWKYVWTRNGCIFARRTDTSPVLSIQRESDIDKISAET